jgi:hypothetical protein
MSSSVHERISRCARDPKIIEYLSSRQDWDAVFYRLGKLECRKMTSISERNVGNEPNLNKLLLLLVVLGVGRSFNF